MIVQMVNFQTLEKLRRTFPILGNDWAEEETISAPRESLDWADAALTNRNVRFYRVKREK